MAAPIVAAAKPNALYSWGNVQGGAVDLNFSVGQPCRTFTWLRQNGDQWETLSSCRYLKAGDRFRVEGGWFSETERYPEDHLWRVAEGPYAPGEMDWSPKDWAIIMEHVES